MPNTRRVPIEAPEAGEVKLFEDLRIPCVQLMC